MDGGVIVENTTIEAVLGLCASRFPIPAFVETYLPRFQNALLFSYGQLVRASSETWKELQLPGGLRDALLEFIDAHPLAERASPKKALANLALSSRSTSPERVRIPSVVHVHRSRDSSVSPAAEIVRAFSGVFNSSNPSSPTLRSPFPSPMTNTSHNSNNNTHNNNYTTNYVNSNNSNNNYLNGNSNSNNNNFTPNNNSNSNSAQMPPLHLPARDQDIGSFLRSLGVGFSAYESLFYSKNIRYAQLLQLGEYDMRELGISAPHAKRMWAALHPPSHQPGPLPGTNGRSDASFDYIHFNVSEFDRQGLFLDTATDTSPQSLSYQQQQQRYRTANLVPHLRTQSPHPYSPLPPPPSSGPREASPEHSLSPQRHSARSQSRPLPSSPTKLSHQQQQQQQIVYPSSPSKHRALSPTKHMQQALPPALPPAQQQHSSFVGSNGISNARPLPSFQQQQQQQQPHRSPVRRSHSPERKSRSPSAARNNNYNYNNNQAAIAAASSVSALSDRQLNHHHQYLASTTPTNNSNNSNSNNNKGSSHSSALPPLMHPYQQQPFNYLVRHHSAGATERPSLQQQQQLQLQQQRGESRPRIKSADGYDLVRDNRPPPPILEENNKYSNNNNEYHARATSRTRYAQSQPPPLPQQQQQQPPPPQQQLRRQQQEDTFSTTTASHENGVVERERREDFDDDENDEDEEDGYGSDTTATATTTTGQQHTKTKSRHRRQSNQSDDQKRNMNGKKMNLSLTQTSTPTAAAAATTTATSTRHLNENGHTTEPFSASLPPLSLPTPSHNSTPIITTSTTVSPATTTSPSLFGISPPHLAPPSSSRASVHLKNLREVVSSPSLLPRTPLNKYLLPTISSPAILQRQSMIMNEYTLPPSIASAASSSSSASSSYSTRNPEEDIYFQMRFVVSCQNLEKCRPIVGMFLKSPNGNTRRLLCHTEWKQKETDPVFSVKLSIEFRRDVPLTVTFGVYQSGVGPLSPWVDHKIVPRDLIGEADLDLTPITGQITKVLHLENPAVPKLDKQLKTRGSTITLEMSRLEKDNLCDWSVKGGINGTYKCILSGGFWDENSFMIEPLDSPHSEGSDPGWTLP